MDRLEKELSVCVCAFVCIFLWKGWMNAKIAKSQFAGHWKDFSFSSSLWWHCLANSQIKPPIAVKALCIYDYMKTWPILFRADFFYATRFNYLIECFHSSHLPFFFYWLNWLLLLIAQKYLKCPRTSSFPKYRSGSELHCLSSQQSAGITFSSNCLPAWWAAERKGETFKFCGQIHSLLEWLLLLFSPWSWSESPDASECV